MSILSRITNRIFPAASTQDDGHYPAPDDDFWYKALSDVTAENALRVSAVMACVRVLSETVASLPLHVYKRQEDGGQEKAVDHPLYSVLHDKPSKRHTSFEWREMGMNALCLNGNFVALKRPGVRGSTSQLVPVTPGAVIIKELPNGKIAYDITMAGGTQRQFTEDEVFHVRGMSLDGVTGLDPIRYASRTICLTSDAEKHGLRYFKSGGRAASHLKVPGRVDKKAKLGYAALVKELSATGCLVTDEGFEWTPLEVTNEAMQYLETRKFQLADIARIYRVPLHLIQEHEKSTSWGTGIESFSRQFLTYTIRPWLTRWEQRLNADLFGEDSDYFCEFNADGMLRGDTLPRYQAHAIAIDKRIKTPNDVRKTEGMNPIDGGDEFPPVAGAAESGTGNGEGNASNRSDDDGSN